MAAEETMRCLMKKRCHIPGLANAIRIARCDKRLELIIPKRFADIFYVGLPARASRGRSPCIKDSDNIITLALK
nr:hypothetical protein TQ38_05315 [Novosphingobium sp. P6W]